MAGDCVELLALGEVRERLHRKANDYFAYEQRRWSVAGWRLLFGATDALLDTQFALSNMPSGIPSNRQSAILACYGFLQALYIQQDAVVLIWKALEIGGDPLSDPRVKRVRELRNRIAGHPARADKMGAGKRPSSAIINLHDIDPLSGFKAVVYYDDETDVIDISFAGMVADNCCGLTHSLLKAEQTMVDRETGFRKLERESSITADFENGLTYTLEKLRCDPDDSRREMAMRMLGRSIDDLEALLQTRNFSYEASQYPIDAIRAGLEMGWRLHDFAAPDRVKQCWWAISEGIDSHANNLLRHLRALDEKLAATPD